MGCPPPCYDEARKPSSDADPKLLTLSASRTMSQKKTILYEISRLRNFVTVTENELI
jgi:hypothetical protein